MCNVSTLINLSEVQTIFTRILSRDSASEANSFSLYSM